MVYFNPSGLAAEEAGFALEFGWVEVLATGSAKVRARDGLVEEAAVVQPAELRRGEFATVNEHIHKVEVMGPLEGLHNVGIELRLSGASGAFARDHDLCPYLHINHDHLLSKRSDYVQRTKIVSKRRLSVRNLTRFFSTT